MLFRIDIQPSVAHTPPAGAHSTSTPTCAGTIGTTAALRLPTPPLRPPIIPTTTLIPPPIIPRIPPPPLRIIIPSWPTRTRTPPRPQRTRTRPAPPPHQAQAAARPPRPPPRPLTHRRPSHPCPRPPCLRSPHPRSALALVLPVVGWRARRSGGTRTPTPTCTRRSIQRATCAASADSPAGLRCDAIWLLLGLVLAVLVGSFALASGFWPCKAYTLKRLAGIVLKYSLYPPRSRSRLISALVSHRQTLQQI
jgi:hypothetical protein